MIDDVYIQQELKSDIAKLNAFVQISFDENYNEEEIYLEIKVTNDNDYTSRKVVSLDQNKLSNIYEVSVEINNPKLWWPNGMGEQNLYNVEINLSDKISQDSKSYKIGLRTIELVREPDSIGKSFSRTISNNLNCSSSINKFSEPYKRVSTIFLSIFLKGISNGNFICTLS